MNVKEEFNYMDVEGETGERTFADKFKSLFSAADYHPTSKDVDESSLRGTVLHILRTIVLSGIDCWKNHPVFLARDYLFD